MPETSQSRNDAYRKSPKEYFANIPKPQVEELVFEWQALARPFKKRKKQHYSTIIIIVILVSMILFFAGQLLPIGVILAATFVYYVMSTVNPGMATNQITTFGIRQDDQLFFWEELGRFWFEDKDGFPTLQLELGRFPGRVTLLLGDAKEEDLRSILQEVLVEQRPPLTAFEKASRWLQDKIPLE